MIASEQQGTYLGNRYWHSDCIFVINFLYKLYFKCSYFKCFCKLSTYFQSEINISLVIIVIVIIIIIIIIIIIMCIIIIIL